MIDLHLHLDGSLDIDTIIELAHIQGVTISDDRTVLKNMLTAPLDCSNLGRYLECFELPLSVMQTKKTIKVAVERLLGKLESQDMIYAEIRFAPQLHTRLGLTQDEIVRAVLNGAKGERKVMARFILCCMRGENNTLDNYETVEMANKYRDSGVVGVDLAGNEAKYKTADYADVFKRANEYGLNITIHAGEADGAESVRQAILLGAKRIGHGTRLIEDKALMDKVREMGIGIEMCPTSNLQTKAVDCIANFPLRTYIANGMLVSVNTDNMCVSDTSISKEIALLSSGIDLTTEEHLKILSSTILMLFVNDAGKLLVAEKIIARFKAILSEMQECGKN